MTQVASAPSPAVGEGATFPLSLVLVNNTPREVVEPETGAHAAPYSTSAPIVVRDADQLQRAQSNVQQLEELHGWTDGLALREPEPVEPAAEAAAPAKRTSKKAAEQ